jgi:uncharacterized protein (TIGR02246 family)
MTMRLVWFLALAAVILSFGAGLAQQAQGDPMDKDALAKRAEAFVEAFHKGDAKALAAFWTLDGDHIDQAGRHMKGRAAIESAFKDMFAANKGLKLRVDSESLRFVTPDVAIEDGTTEVIPSDGEPPTLARFSIVHVKQNGHWYLSSVRNSEIAPPSNMEHLIGLEWLIGNWSGVREKGEVEQLTLARTKTQNFIVGRFSTSSRKVSLGSASVRIGWDPVAKRVRSWIFDDTGAFGKGAWTAEGKKWVVKTTSILPDGKKAAATLVIASVDADTISMQAKDRSVGDERLPDVDEVKLKRVK